MTAKTVRRLLVAVCAVGVVGMIVTSVADATGGALVFGLLTAGSAISMILVTAVTDGGRTRAAGADERAAARLEERVLALIATGADETAVRTLVSDAVRLGQRMASDR